MNLEISDAAVLRVADRKEVYRIVRRRK